MMGKFFVFMKSLSPSVITDNRSAMNLRTKRPFYFISAQLRAVYMSQVSPVNWANLSHENQHHN